MTTQIMKPSKEKCTLCESRNIEKYTEANGKGEKSYSRCKECNNIERIYK